MEELLRLEKIRKTFPGVVANDDVHLTVEKGRIHALLGENGAGKTTLMNCVYGVYRPDSGQIFWKGQPVEIGQARDAIALGIGMVHQHFMLVPPLTVAENVVLGLPSAREPFLDLRTASRKIRELGERFGLRVDPDAPVWQLPVGAQQRVEIIKALYRNAKLLILDEPTAVLTPGEVEDLFTVLRELTDEGLSIIFITHKLEEVMAVCSKVTVMRNGHVVDTVEAANTDTHELAKMMVGREVFLNIEKPEMPIGDVILSVSGVSAHSDRGVPALKNLSFEVREGEILGIAGVDGNGQTELSEVISGLREVTSGSITVAGQEVANQAPREIMDLNVAFIPSDRQHMGLLLDFSVGENLIGKEFCRTPFSKRGFLQEKVIDDFVEEAIDDYDIRTPHAEVEVKLLSGGNQQKVILARELSRQPQLLIAAQPTRGLDIGATEYVRRQMVDARNAGTAILLISTELEEILSLSDRIAVLYEGEIMGIVPAEEADVHDIGLMMAGAKRRSLEPAPTTQA
ncbi:MAG: ABC transporter ATP-binding protein [Anaerolineae bacterium]